MRIIGLLLALALGLSAAISSAHQDALVTIDDDGNLLGLPAAYGPAKLQITFSDTSIEGQWVPAISKVVLTLGKSQTELPRCVTVILNSKSLDDVRISASWYHSEETLPYYLNVMFLDPGYATREETLGFGLLFNLRTAKLMSMEVMILEHEGTIGRDLPVDLKDLCGGSDVLPEIVTRMWPNNAMQRSALVVTPLAHCASASPRLEQQAARRLRAAADRGR